MITELHLDSKTALEIGFAAVSVWKDIEIFAKDLSGNIVYSVVLHGAWLKQRQPTNMNASTPEVAWKWDYIFYYNWIEDKL